MNIEEYMSQESVQTRLDYEFAHRCNHTLHAYIDITGDLIAGTLLSQIMYWFSADKNGRRRVRVYKDGKYWLAKRREDWMQEIRISKKQYDTAINKLIKNGFVTTAKYHFNGAPVTHITPNDKNINKAVNEWKKAVALELMEADDELSRGAMELPERVNYQNGKLPNGEVVNSPNGKLEAHNFPNGEYGNHQNGNMEVPQRGISLTDTTYSNYSTSNTPNQKTTRKSNTQRREDSNSTATSYSPYDLEDILRGIFNRTLNNEPYIENTDQKLRYGSVERNIEEIVLYFYRKYNERFGKYGLHPILKDDTFRNIIREYCVEDGVLAENYIYDTSDYKELIDLYFETDFESGTNYHLPHFMTRNVRETLYRKSREKKREYPTENYRKILPPPDFPEYDTEDYGELPFE